MQSDITSALGGNGLLTAANLDPGLYQKTPTLSASTPGGTLKAAKKFEAMYLSEMLQPMFEGIKADKVFGGGNGEEMFQSLAVDEYAKALTTSGGVGVTAAVQREMLRMQEQAHAPTRS